MKITDIMTPAGFVLGAALIGYGIVSGGPFSIFIDIPSIFICVGGSLSALFITYTMDEIKEMFGSLGNALNKSIKTSIEGIIQKDIIVQFSNLSQRARKDGLLSLEEDISNLEDPFLKKGMQMVVDGIEPETIKEILELDIYETENRGMNVAGMYTAWGGYAPGFGMIGTLIGLVQMMQNLNDIQSIAVGMGVALLTTFYGSFLANYFCNPIGANLKRQCALETGTRTMMLEGILAIQSGVNPRIVEEKLLTYLSAKERLEYINSNTENTEGVA